MSYAYKNEDNSKMLFAFSYSFLSTTFKILPQIVLLLEKQSNQFTARYEHQGSR